jgi:predicted nucleic acid-binding protein
MADFVLDASVAAAWCFQTEATKYTQALLEAIAGGGREAVAPTLFAYEIRNTVLTGLRRKRIERMDAEEFLISLRDLQLHLIEPAVFDSVIAVAIDYGLTFYDASYLNIALQYQLPLASLDAALTRAAERAGVAMFRP